MASTSSRPGETAPKKRSRMESAILDYRLLSDLRATLIRAAHLSPRDPIPGIADRLLDLIPGGLILTTMLVALPPAPEIGFSIIPAAARVVLGRLESIPIRWTESIEIIGTQDVRPAREVLL